MFSSDTERYPFHERAVYLPDESRWEQDPLEIYLKLVIIDHLAEPHLGDAVEYADILALTDLGNVYMKLSGLNLFANDEPLFESAMTFTKQVIEA